MTQLPPNTALHQHRLTQAIERGQVQSRTLWDLFKPFLPLAIIDASTDSGELIVALGSLGEARMTAVLKDDAMIVTILGDGPTISVKVDLPLDLRQDDPLPKAAAACCDLRP
jgi:hypothetical protein